MAEPEVLPDHDAPCVQPVGQHGADELARAQPGELGGELEHADRVRAEFPEKLGAAPQGAQLRRVGTGPDHLGRVRVERDHHQRQAQVPRGRGCPGHDPLMPPVHAVEDADGHHGGPPGARHLTQTHPALHDAAPLPFTGGLVHQAPLRSW